MDRDALLDSLLAEEIAQARMAAGQAGTRAGRPADRDLAWDYYFGEMADVPAEPGGSTAVSTDVADVVEYLMPSLMRIFTASDTVVRFEPTGPEDEEAARQATDYVNHLFARNQGFLVLYTWFKDALVGRNGIVKVWWQDTEEPVVERLEGLSAEAVALLEGDPSVTVLEVRQDAGDPAGAVPHYSVRVRRDGGDGRLRVEGVPPEEFLISARARSLADAPFCAHRVMRSRSELRAAGYDPGLIDDLPAGDEVIETADPGDIGGLDLGAGDSDPSRVRIAVYECWVRTDYDGDGIAELRHITLAGGPGGVILDNREAAEIPFCDLTPMPVPHRWEGRSIADLVMDIQRQKTALVRQILNNLYRVNNPQRLVNLQKVRNPDALVNQRIGGLIQVDGPGPLAEAARDLAVPFVAKESFGILEYLDNQREARTGAGRGQVTADLDRLQNQTATAVQQSQSMVQAKVELIARIFAETGIKRLFGLMLRLCIRHQDRARMIRLRGRWVEMDPRAWQADMDLAVNVGLGAGSRERDVGAISRLIDQQEKILTSLGPDNPLVGLRQYYNALTKLAETAGLKGVEMFFTDPGSAPPPAPGTSAAPSPEQQRHQAELQMKREKQAADHQLAVEKLRADIALKGRELEAEIALKQAAIAARASTATEIAKPE